MEHVIRANNIGLNGLHREELAGRNLLQSGSMENVVNTGHCVTDRLRVTDITDVKLDLFGILWMLGLKLMAHIILLLLITGEDTNLLQVGIQEVLQNGRTKRTSTTSDHKGCVIKCRHFYFLLYRYVYATQHIQTMNCIVLKPLQNAYLSLVAFHAVRFHFLKICTL